MNMHHPAPSRAFFALILWLAFCAHESLHALAQSPSATSENTKFTPAPGQETHAVEKLIDQAKTALESGEGVGREMYSLTVEETIKNLDALVSEAQVEAPAATR